MNEELSRGMVLALHKDIAKYVLSKNLSIKIFSSKPKKQGMYWSITFWCNMLDKRRNNVGEIRGESKVSMDSDYCIVKIEWTKPMFGFWFSRSFELDADGFSFDISGNMAWITSAIIRIANRSVSLISQLRMHTKTKKNQSKDRSFRLGLT